MTPYLSTSAASQTGWLTVFSFRFHSLKVCSTLCCGWFSGPLAFEEKVNFRVFVKRLRVLSFLPRTVTGHAGVIPAVSELTAACVMARCSVGSREAPDAVLRAWGAAWGAVWHGRLFHGAASSGRSSPLRACAVLVVGSPPHERAVTWGPVTLATAPGGASTRPGVAHGGGRPWTRRPLWPGAAPRRRGRGPGPCPRQAGAAASLRAGGQGVPRLSRTHRRGASVTLNWRVAQGGGLYDRGPRTDSFWNKLFFLRLRCALRTMPRGFNRCFSLFLSVGIVSRERAPHTAVPEGVSSRRMLLNVPATGTPSAAFGPLAQPPRSSPSGSRKAQRRSCRSSLTALQRLPVRSRR